MEPLLEKPYDSDRFLNQKPTSLADNVQSMPASTAWWRTTPVELRLTHMPIFIHTQDTRPIITLVVFRYVLFPVLTSNHVIAICSGV